jgi:hypothetical protein
MCVSEHDADVSSVAGIELRPENNLEKSQSPVKLPWPAFWNVNLHSLLSFRTPLSQSIPLECQMSKRKPATASKHARSPKIAEKAQRAAHAIVRSPKVAQRSVAERSAELSPSRHKEPKPTAPLVIEHPVPARQENYKQAITDNGLRKGFDLPSAAANVRAYQAKLSEMAQANMKLAFEFSQRLATIRSPVEFLNVIAEFATKRIALLGKHSIEMVELGTKRVA